MSAVRFRYPAQKFTKINTMEKYRVIKEFAGIEVGTEISIPKDKIKHMVANGYVEPIAEQIESIKPQFSQQNKAEMKPRKNKRNAD